MRLIDADKLKREDLCEICLSADCGDCFSDKNFEEWIASQPTTYDVESVIEQLEDYKMWKEFIVYDFTYRELKIITRAIEIVKGGAE